MFFRLRRLIFAFLFMILSVLIGIGGYMIIEGYGVLDAFYMSIVTISTVGFREVEPLTDGGKIFTSLFIIFNLIFLAFLVSTL